MTKNVTKIIDFVLSSCRFHKNKMEDSVWYNTKLSTAWKKIACTLVLGLFVVTTAGDAWAVAQNKTKEKNVTTFMQEYGIKAKNQGDSVLRRQDLLKEKSTELKDKLEAFESKRDALRDECAETWLETVSRRIDDLKESAERSGQRWENADGFWESALAVVSNTWDTGGSAIHVLWNGLRGGKTIDEIKDWVKNEGAQALLGDKTSYVYQISNLSQMCENAAKGRQDGKDYTKDLDELRNMATELENIGYDKRLMEVSGYNDEIYEHCYKLKNGEISCVQFVVNVEENKIMSIAGASAGCMPLPFKLYEARSCLFCPMFEVIYNAVQKASTRAYATLAKPLSTLLLIGLAIWIALMVLANVSAMTKQDAPKFLTDLFKNSFKVVIIFILLRYSSIVYDIIIGPLLKAGFEFGGSFLQTSKDIISSCEIKSSLLATNGVIPTYVYTHLMCFIEAVQYELATTQAIGSSLMCIARHAGSDNLAVFAKVLPDFSMLFQGFLIWVISFIISIAFGFYLIDATIQLGIFGMVLPFLLMCYPFKITHGYFATGVGVFVNSWFIFVFMGLVTNITLALIGQGATGGKGDATTIEAAINGNDITTLKNLLDIGFAGFVVLVACCVFAVKLMSKVQELAGTFSGGGLHLGIGNKIGGLAASGVTNTAKLGISKGVQATKAVGGAVANAKFLGKDGEEKSLMDGVRAARSKAGRGVGKMVQWAPKQIGKFAGRLAGRKRRDTSE